jgi:hypothetical protein
MLRHAVREALWGPRRQPLRDSQAPTGAAQALGCGYEHGLQIWLCAGLTGARLRALCAGCLPYGAVLRVSAYGYAGSRRPLWPSAPMSLWPCVCVSVSLCLCCLSLWEEESEEE